MSIALPYDLSHETCLYTVHGVVYMARLAIQVPILAVHMCKAVYQFSVVGSHVQGLMHFALLICVTTHACATFSHQGLLIMQIISQTITQMCMLEQYLCSRCECRWLQSDPEQSSGDSEDDHNSHCR